MIVEGDGTVVAANPAVAALLGQVPREIEIVSASNSSGPMAIEASAFESGGRSYTLARLSQRTPAAVLQPEFLSMLTHELRTPLQAILGWTQLLGSAARDPQTTQRLLDAIERNVHWQAQVVEDLLEMSRISSGDVHLALRPTRASAVVAAAIEQISAAAAAKRVRLVRRLDVERDEIRADTDHLLEAIRRMLSDALRYTAAGGEVEILLERVGGSAVRIAITDGGDEDDPASSHASGWFRRAPAFSTANFGPFGVGMATVQRIVEMHGGTVGAESAGPGRRGARFFAVLPLAAQE